MSIPVPNVPTTNLAEAQEAIAKYAEHVRGLKLYSAADINAIKAEAWDEAYKQAIHDLVTIQEAPTPNPYRSQTRHEGEK